MIFISRMINEDNQSAYFWMDPNTKLHSVGEMGHFRWAANLLKTDVNVYDTMYLNGWVRVASAFYRGDRFLAFNYNSSKPPTNRQIKALKDFCIEIGCEMLRDDTKGRQISIDESRISLKRLIKELQEDMETVDYPLKKLPSGIHQQQPADWTKFKLNGVYGDGDVLRYVQSQHDGFEDDDRVDGNYRLQAVDPNTIQDSEWHIDDEMVQSLSQSKKQFPPIVIDKHGSIIDGGHRHAAAKLRGDKKILVFKPTMDINEGPDGIEYNGVNTYLWDYPEYTRMFFILAKIDGRENVSFCYLRDDGEVVSSKPEFDSVFSENPPKDSMTTHGDLISYIMDTIGLNLYDSEDPGDKPLAMGDVVSMRLVHGRVFEVSGQLIMSCWEKSDRLRSQKSDIDKLMDISGIDPKKVLYETSDAPEEFSSYEDTFGSGSDKESSDKSKRSDSEIERLEKLHLDANLKKKILKLPPNKFQLAADKLNISTIELKNWLGRNVAESMFPKDFDRHSLGSCMAAAALATDYFLGKGITNFKVVEGWVSLHPDQEEEDWSTHTWIEFSNGRKFDPTRKQWKHWGFDPDGVEFMKVKKKYTPQEYQRACQRQPDDLSKFKKEPLNERTNLVGEWWIDNHGEAMFADGDVGDMNHEAYVIQYLTNEFLNFFGLDDQEKGDLSQYEEDVADVLRSKGVITDENEEDFSNDPWNFVYEWLKTQNYMKDEGQLQEAFFIALGSTQRDAREYALKHWKWKRMKGNVIQTQQLTPEDLKIIVSGVHNAYGDQMEDEDVDPTFGLEVMATRSWYGDIPLSVLEKKSTMALNQYRSRYE